MASSFRQRVEQDAVVARMQADGRFVEDVADALQVGAELGGQADALRLAARQGGRRAIERQVAQTDFLEEAQARAQFGDDVAGDRLASRPASFEGLAKNAEFA